MSTTSPRVALRADASQIMGVGHVRRCISLGIALQNVGVRVVLVTRDLGVDLTWMAQSSSVELLRLPAPRATESATDRVPHASWAGVGWLQDASETSMLLRDWRPDWVIVDEYAFDSRWHRHLHEALRVRVGIVDDLADRDLYCEILVDHNVHQNHRQKYLNRIGNETFILGGPRFALLDVKYSKASPYIVNEIVKSIGIFMGGIDAAQLSNLALRACRRIAEFRGLIEIVTTRANPNGEKLKVLAAEWPDTVVTFDLPDLAEFFARHDLQIGAGGGANLERCCVGAPALVLAAAANQEAVLPELRTQGAIALFIPSPMRNEKRLGQAIRALINSSSARRILSERARALVDGFGAKRVALQIASTWLRVRSAKMSDARMIYEWRSHPVTRATARISDEFGLPEHDRWMRKMVFDGQSILLVGVVGMVDVGVIRFDIDSREKGRATVSLYLDPQLHGLGLGTALLRAGEGFVLKHISENMRFVATIVDGNESSKRMFASSGYSLSGGQWEKHMVLSSMGGVIYQ